MYKKIEKQSLEANVGSGCPSTIQEKGNERYLIGLAYFGLTAGLGL